MSLRLLVIGLFRPDSFVRWISDGFVYAGCRVERCGPTDFHPYPEDERPRVRESIFVRQRSPTEMTASLKTIVDYYSELGFTPDVIFIDDWEGVTWNVTGIRQPLAVRSDGWGTDFKQYPKFGTGALSPGVDPYTFRFVRRSLHHGDHVLASNLTTSTVGEQVRRLQQHTAVLVDSSNQLELALRAAACGCRIFCTEEAVATIHEVLDCGDWIGVPMPAPYYRTPHASDELVLASILSRSTWAHRARQVLADLGLEGGSVPRL